MIPFRVSPPRSANFTYFLGATDQLLEGTFSAVSTKRNNKNLMNINLTKYHRKLCTARRDLSVHAFKIPKFVIISLIMNKPRHSFLLHGALTPGMWQAQATPTNGDSAENEAVRDFLTEYDRLNFIPSCPVG